MKNSYKSRLTDGPVSKQLNSLTLTGIGGFLAINIFNLTDTFFVSRLGTDALAAMGFTFPVILIINSFAMGISLGSGSVLSRAMGSGDQHLMKRTATDGVLLSVIFVGLISAVGLMTLDPLFRLMGASGEVLRLTKEYMFIWYAGAVATIVPPVSDSCLRATGDMVRPLIVMIVIASMNAVLDPILIFGLLGFPAMGIEGAALATILSRCFGMAATLGFLHFHAGLVEFNPTSWKEIKTSWKRILHIGLPSAVTQIFPHFTRGIITRLAAGAGGASAVAALAAGTRIESLGMIYIGAFSTALVPMMGQNWGAEKWDRVKEIRKAGFRISLMYGVAALTATLLFAPDVARVFTKEPQVIRLTALYLRLMGAAGFSLALYTGVGQMLNSAGIPRPAAFMIITGSLIMIPLAFIGSVTFAVTGLISGMALGQIITAGIAVIISRKYLAGPALENFTK